jgi:drug/metabolite transporter (DMT)-like permease
VKKSLITAHIYLFIVALIYGANYTIAKSVLSDGYIGPNGFIFLRVSSGAILFFLFHKFFVNEKVEKKDLGLIALCGLFGVAINQLCFFNGLKLTSPVNCIFFIHKGEDNSSKSYWNYNRSCRGKLLDTGH